MLQPTARGPLGEFGRILIQDGCSFAVKDALREHYPGRFKKQNPAAVELHVTMSLLDESVERGSSDGGQGAGAAPSAIARGVAR